MGLIAALKRRGLEVQPFKAGPDYIDPTYHTLAAGRPCRNIDTWMVPSERALGLFENACHEMDVAVIEGVMGVFDGFSYESEEGSSAQIAKLTQAPVFLVMDVGKMARSAGALALGYTKFDPNLNIAGFILNRCGSERHYEGVKLAVEQATQRPVFGWLPKDAELHIPERHLGLVPTDERGQLTDFINHAATVVEQHLDLDQMLALAHTAPTKVTPPITVTKQSTSVRLAVARDAAFSFYYEDNLNLLRQAGAEIAFFSPLTDSQLPEGCAGLYLGGGFPEMFPAEIARNVALHRDIQQAHQRGMPIYAECGGFMVLTEAITDLEGQTHEMVGLVPGRTQMQKRLMSLGYRVVKSQTGNFLLPAGVTTRGHEFHWSSWEREEEVVPAWHIQARQANASAHPNGYATENLIASYVHLHFAHNLDVAPNFVQACQRWQEANGMAR